MLIHFPAGQRQSFHCCLWLMLQATDIDLTRSMSSCRQNCVQTALLSLQFHCCRQLPSQRHNWSKAHVLIQSPVSSASLTLQSVLMQAATKAGTLLTRPGTGLVESEYVRAVKLGHRAGRQAREEQDDLVSHPLWRLTCGALTAGLYIAHRVAGALQPRLEHRLPT